MKKIILLGLLFNFCLGFAQDYKPLLNEEYYWDVCSWSYSNPMGCYFSGQRYYIDGVAVLNGKEYKVVKSNSLQTEEDVSCVTNPYQPIMGESNISGYMREDLTQQKVYTFKDGVEYLVYDYSLEIGDTFEINYPYTGLSGQIVEVVAIEQVLHPDGEWVKKFVFQNENGLDFNETVNYYTEGIGGTEGLFFPFGLRFEYYTDMVGFGNTLSIQDNESLKSFTVSPNPCNDMIQINFLNGISQIDSIEIHNSLGQQVFLTKNILEKTFISIDSKPGIYFLSIKDFSGHIYYQKIIRQ
jgi:hypothetical protein